MKLILFDFSGVFIDTSDPVVLPVLKVMLNTLYKEYILTIVSSLSHGTIEEILAKEEIITYFKDILGIESGISKIVKIKMLLKKYNVAPAEAVYITDTVGDIKEARECGVKAIAVTWGLHDREKLLNEKPFALVDTPRELEERIEEYFK